MIYNYPTEDELKKLKEWDAFHDPKGLIDFIRDIWWMPDWGFILTGKRALRLQLHTGGWSGNEDIMNVLAENFSFWFYFEKHLRGGHYYFKIPLKKKGAS